MHGAHDYLRQFYVSTHLEELRAEAAEARKASMLPRTPHPLQFWMGCRLIRLGEVLRGAECRRGCADLPVTRMC